MTEIENSETSNEHAVQTISKKKLPRTISKEKPSETARRQLVIN